MSIYITLIREHVEGTPEISALIKTDSIGGENIPRKNGSGEKGRFEKKEKETVTLYWDYYYQVFFRKNEGGYLMNCVSPTA